MRAIIGMLLASVGFVLTVLTLVADRTRGFMEDYHLIMLNTSGLGKDIIPTGDKTPTCKHGGILGKICESATSRAGDALEDLTGNDAAGKLAETLGIQQWYSLHVMNLCEGTFLNATGAYNTTDCTEPLQSPYFNISALIDHDLGFGPLSLNLADLGLTEDLQRQLNKIPRLFKALSAIYILAIVFSGLSLLLAAGRRFVRPPFVLLASLTSASTAVLGVLGLLVGNVMVTGSVRPVADRINEFGQEIGISASSSWKFLIITWCAFVLMVVVTVIWAGECCQDVRARRFVLRQRYSAHF